MADDDYSQKHILNPAAAAALRAQRFMRFQTVDVPRLRQIEFLLNAVGVLLHNFLVQGHVTLSDASFIVGVLGSYSLLAWLDLGLLWTRVRFVDIGDVFLVLDVFMFAFVVYVSGANHSYLWPVFLARPADQVATTFKRSIWFAHLGPLAFFGLLAYITGVEHRAVDWSAELAKGGFLYFMSIYIALTARTAEARRNKLADARRLAERAVRSADDRRQELELALTRLEGASKAKSEFLANVSHELRTPLNAVMGTSDLLLDSPLTREQREMVGVLRDSADSLTHIVNDILDLARVEAKRMPLEHIPLRIRDIAGATLRMFSARVHNRPIQLICHINRDVPDALTGDPIRLRQVLTNLLGNAVKFTEQGEIVLTVARDQLRDGRVALRFSVRDTGIGIPRDRQSAIFEAFTQVDGSSTRKYGGTGLGLTIANELVALMDGRMWVESEPGHGSSFSFVAWFGRTAGQDSVVEAPWGPQTLRVLVADGSDTARHAVEEMLAVWPVTVVHANGGHAALAVSDPSSAGTPIDLALISVDLPGINGFEVAARLRATGARAPHVIMMLRSRESPLDAERAVSLGALYVVTPITPHTLAEVLRGAFGQHPQQTALAPRWRPAVRPLRVLVADDHEVNQAVVGAVLKKWGHAVAMALDGQEALDKLTHEEYDLVLMDLQMPVMDGLEATRRLRQREAASGGRHVPVIAMTARAMEEDRAQCLAAGMNGYLSKPINQSALFEVLAQCGGPAGGAPTPANDPSSIAPIISDPHLVRHVAQLFLSTAPGQMARLARALELGDAGQAGSVAHSLKGAAAYFAGAETATAEAIEDLCTEGRVELALEQLPQLRRDIDALAQRLETFLATAQH